MSTTATERGLLPGLFDHCLDRPLAAIDLAKRDQVNTCLRPNPRDERYPRNRIDQRRRACAAALALGGTVARQIGGTLDSSVNTGAMTLPGVEEC